MLDHYCNMHATVTGMWDVAAGDVGDAQVHTTSVLDPNCLLAESSVTLKQ